MSVDPRSAAETWLESHPYLAAVGRLDLAVRGALGGLDVRSPVVPDWNACREELRRGVPVLRSSLVELDLEPAGGLVLALIETLAEGGTLAGEAGRLKAEANAAGMTPDRVARWLLGDDPWTPSNPGLMRYLGWAAAARCLAPVVRAFDAWCDEETWSAPYCPICGSPPAMAQLAGTDPGRRRFLSCGGCRTRWRFRRTACPFCEGDSQRLESLVVEGDSGLRIDWCASCRGYLKTYDGAGNEGVHLSDWSSLHLDVAALDRGLRRTATSLYDVESVLR